MKTYSTNGANNIDADTTIAHTKEPINKKTWMKIHAYASLFFLPVALLYIITGIGYIFKFNQDAGARITEIPITSAIIKGQERDVILDLLAAHHLAIPSRTTLSYVRGNPTLGTIAYNASIIKDKEGKHVVKVIERNIYDILLLMHKSAGKKLEVGALRFSVFDCLAVAFGLSLLLFYLSGLIVTSFCKANRSMGVCCVSLGLVVAIITVYASV